MGMWTTTAQRLPGEDEAVQFMIDARCVPLRGCYRRGEFATRWWRYPAWSVERWSVIERDAAVAHAPSAHAFNERAAAVV
ncbi:hypothetical protein [Dokdonella fugitiva]|uniref:hypothetical protein n=1 Tax=Dokdonella fugitiva TaxID=328517 RepID=UPI0015FD418A|nr:hypothetical protein [Dokdonella fugitiva]MBA8885641.1 hypothetical protein [Dokdonella fugitiva]